MSQSPEQFPQQTPEQAPAQAAESQQPLERHQVHHTYIWLGGLYITFMVLFVAACSSISIIAEVFFRETSGAGPEPSLVLPLVLGAIGIVLLTLALVGAYQVVSYKHLYYELGPEEFNFYSGIFYKKRVHIPYQRIQSVDQHASLLQRIAGVCSVSIDTAGGAANKAVRVPYLQKSNAEELRRELFARKQYVIAVQGGTSPQVAAAAVAQAAGVAIPVSTADATAYANGAQGTGQAQPLTPGVFPANGQAHASGNILDAPAEIWQDVNGVFGGMSVDTGRVTYEYGLSNKELVLTGISNNAAFVLIALGLLGAVTQFVSQLAPMFMDSVRPVVGRAVAVGDQLFGGNYIAAGVAFFMLILVGLWVLSAVGTCISYGGFRACRRNSRIEVEHGLLQHTFQGVDVDRVQSVVVRQSFIRRLMGYCELSLGKIDAETEGSDKQRSNFETRGLIIHPFVKLEKVPEILAGIIPEYADVPTQLTPVAPVALRRALIRRSIIQGTGLWLAVLVSAALLVFHLAILPQVAADEQAVYRAYADVATLVGYALCVVLFILDVVGSVLWFRGSGFAYNKRFMQVSNGGFSRETVSFPRRKIQFGYTKTNPFQRRAHTATVSARIAAGVGGTTLRLIDATQTDAEAWLAWVKPRTR